MPSSRDAREEDFEVDVGDEYAEMEEEEMLVRALPSATVSASTAEAMSLNDRNYVSNDVPIGVSEPAAASAVELTEEQKERIARNKQIAMQRLAEREAAKAFENAAAEDSSGASTDGRSHMSRLFIYLIFGTHTIYDHTSHVLLLNTFLSIVCFTWGGVINPLLCLRMRLLLPSCVTHSNYGGE